MIFHEIYSVYYQTVAKILEVALDHPLKKDEICKIIEKYAFSESVLSIEPALREQKWQLIRSDGTTVLKNHPSMPLTTIQKRWLKSICQDPRIHLFQDDLKEIDFPEIEPLFTLDDFYIFDQYQDGDDYTDKVYIRNFRMILDAIKNQYPLEITTYNHKGQKVSMKILPKYLEYSEKDDKFRVALSVSGETEQTLMLAEKLKRRGSSLISITLTIKAAPKVVKKPVNPGKAKITKLKKEKKEV